MVTDVKDTRNTSVDNKGLILKIRHLFKQNNLFCSCKDYLYEWKKLFLTDQNKLFCYGQNLSFIRGTLQKTKANHSGLPLIITSFVSLTSYSLYFRSTRNKKNGYLFCFVLTYLYLCSKNH
jgi:hypothetical protein